MPIFTNPFRPGAGHKPPYLAGRDVEKNEFAKLLKQDVILSNLIITGLRGVGKTVLLEELKPMAMAAGWLWVGTDLSESTSVSEDTIVNRLLADLSVISSGIRIQNHVAPKGFSQVIEIQEKELNYSALCQYYQNCPGLAADRLKAVLEFVWNCLSGMGCKGLIFAYDEAQTMSDHAKNNQFPLSLLLDVFQSIQRKSIPFMLIMVGLPTLFPKLVETRTYAERMFNVQMLGKLNENDSRDAILKPIKKADSALQFNQSTVNLITQTSGGYPYFVQYICKELFDVFLQQLTSRGGTHPIAISAIVKKLDKDFFAGRWARTTDRQRELLTLIASLPNCDDEFTVQDIVLKSKEKRNPFSASHVNQMLVSLSDAGLIYKNRRGQYAFAVPLLGQFIQRQEKEITEIRQLNLPLTPPPTGS
jgi:type II secretory pathway predicted ATPase ExeA